MPSETKVFNGCKTEIGLVRTHNFTLTFLKYQKMYEVNGTVIDLNIFYLL